MTTIEPNIKEEQTCKNCGDKFHGNYCPSCGQSIKEIERPISSLISDLMGSVFSFDTRFWETLIAILFKPGVLTKEYIKGRRVKYMPPFRFYLFVSFIFFLLLRAYSSQVREGNVNSFSVSVPDSSSISSSYDSLGAIGGFKRIVYKAPKIKEKESDESNNPNADFINEHPEVFMEPFLANLSWSLFLLVPFYAFLLWLFFRKSQHYYITHLILAINQHAFMFVILSLMLVMALLLPEFTSSFRSYLWFLIPIYSIIGLKTLHKEKVLKLTFKAFAIGFIYVIVVSAVTASLAVLVATQNGIFSFYS